MTTINDFALLDYLMAQSGQVSESAEDEYFTRLDEETELTIPIMPVSQTRFTRTEVHHYQYHTIVKVQPTITNLQKNVVVHIYHYKGESK